MQTRREFLTSTAALGGIAAFGLGTGATATTGVFEITRTKSEWQARLSPAQYAILRKGRT